MTHKRWVKSFFTVFLLLILVPPLLLWLVDPLKIFHAPFIGEDRLQKNMRHQALGIIKHHKFDSIILGSSMLENTSAKEAGDVLGGIFFNLSLAGSDFAERAVILDYLLKERTINKVLYSLDYKGLVYNVEKSTEEFDFLYDNNLFNDIRVYYNTRYLFGFVQGLAYWGRAVDFDRPNAWFKIPEYSKRFNGFEHWLNWEGRSELKIILHTSSTKKVEQEKKVPVFSCTEKQQKYFQEYIVKYAKQYPGTEFIFVIPPYSTLNNGLHAQYVPELFLKIQNSIACLVKETAGVKNISVYGFADKPFTDRIENYSDLEHYSERINSEMLYWIAKKDGLLTVDNIDSYLAGFREKSLAFDLSEYVKKVKEYFGK